MSPELERLVKLQEIETRSTEAQTHIAEAPVKIAALDARLTAARDQVAKAKQAIADNQTHRRTLDKDLIAAQQRLSKYKEQLMAVKTNDEYHAMQHQISAAEAEVGRIEEQVLINMMDLDDRNTALKAAETALKADETTLARERAAIEADASAQKAVAEQMASARAEVVPQLSRAALEMFNRVLKARQGIAVAQAIGGHCSICHVRLRPQVYNTIITNDKIVQCDSCQRVLYFDGTRQRSAEGQAALEAAHARQIDHERPTP
jgi:predicted  nucleic acid-binding Zn-ribbon protein